MGKRLAVMVVTICLLLGAGGSGFGLRAESLKEQNEALMQQLRSVFSLSEEQMEKIREIFNRSGYMGQGNPAVTAHPVSVEDCRQKFERLSIDYEIPAFDRICADRYMAPLYDPETQKPEDAEVCIDRFEFPGIPCAYPVVWVRAREAVQICEAMGKRICDAHEWEGACAGRLLEPDYRFDLAGGRSASQTVSRMRTAHNKKYKEQKRWSYGPQYRKGVCAAASRKSPGCPGGNWSKCGSNTYPAGYFPDCRSPLMVSDLNGNAAEHMNLPFSEAQMASRGSKQLGYTEMKGSWFIFDRYRAHQDWCRWRAPYWHGSRIMDEKSHHNYHLGFRCCKSLKAASK